MKIDTGRYDARYNYIRYMDLAPSMHLDGRVNSNYANSTTSTLTEGLMELLGSPSIPEKVVKDASPGVEKNIYCIPIDPRLLANDPSPQPQDTVYLPEPSFTPTSSDWTQSIFHPSDGANSHSGGTIGKYTAPGYNKVEAGTSQQQRTPQRRRETPVPAPQPWRRLGLENPFINRSSNNTPRTPVNGKQGSRLTLNTFQTNGKSHVKESSGTPKKKTKKRKRERDGDGTEDTK
ncbi:hypothetical protein GGS21DRAFT_69744 [Xylaria nigripes]|nr:hypothetical protein GGS21DRAFT_69744 [Xylaria nigripes]